MSWDAEPGFGWVPDLLDPRDFTPGHDRVRELLAGLRRGRARRPTSADWSEFLPPPPELHGLAAGVPVALTGLAEYFERRAFGRSADLGWVFLDRVTRSLARQPSAGPVGFRAALRALARFGLPPRYLCPPDPTRLPDDPPALLFGFAREFAPLVYLRLDTPGTSGGGGLAAVRGFVGAGFPVALGVTVFDGWGVDAGIPFPSAYDAPRGGQAVIAVGLDDAMRVRSERGAFRVRGGWGPGWGDGGFGWLPYRYLADGLAADCWTILRPDWLTGGDFAAPG